MMDNQLDELAMLFSKLQIIQISLLFMKLTIFLQAQGMCPPDTSSCYSIALETCKCTSRIEGRTPWLWYCI